MKSFHTRDFIGLYYPSLMETGGDKAFGVVRPSIRPSEFRLRASSLQLLAGIQRNFMGTINTKKRLAYRRLVQVRPFNTELWPLIYLRYAYNNRFRDTSLQIWAGIQRNLMETTNTKSRCAYCRHVPVRPCITELWPLISYAVCM
jgi:hypothetical protein